MLWRLTLSLKLHTNRLIYWFTFWASLPFTGSLILTLSDFHCGHVVNHTIQDQLFVTTQIPKVRHNEGKTRFHLISWVWFFVLDNTFSICSHVLFTSSNCWIFLLWRTSDLHSEQKSNPQLTSSALTNALDQAHIKSFCLYHLSASLIKYFYNYSYKETDPKSKNSNYKNMTLHLCKIMSV